MPESNDKKLVEETVKEDRSYVGIPNPNQKEIMGELNYFKRYYLAKVCRRLSQAYRGENMDALEYILSIRLTEFVFNYLKQYDDYDKALAEFPYKLATQTKDMLLEFFKNNRYHLRKKLTDPKYDLLETKQERDFLRAYTLIEIAAYGLATDGELTDDFLKLCSFNMSDTIKKDICKAAELTDEEYEQVKGKLFNEEEIRKNIKEALIAEDEISKGGVAK